MVRVHEFHSIVLFAVIDTKGWDRDMLILLLKRCMSFFPWFVTEQTKNGKGLVLTFSLVVRWRRGMRGRWGQLLRSRVGMRWLVRVRGVVGTRVGWLVRVWGQMWWVCGQVRRVRGVWRRVRVGGWGTGCRRVVVRIPAREVAVARVVASAVRRTVAAHCGHIQC